MNRITGVVVLDLTYPQQAVDMSRRVRLELADLEAGDSVRVTVDHRTPLDIASLLPRDRLTIAANRADTLHRWLRALEQE